MARLRRVDLSQAEEMPLTNACVMDACQSQGEVSIFPLDRLPCEVLLHVITFLTKNDRLRLASVCRTWRDLIYSSPRLWRSKLLRLGCSGQTVNSKRAYFYAQRFGHHLRKVAIVCDHPQNHACKLMAICFRKLLISLPNPTLTSFRVADLRLGNASPSVVSSIRLILSRMLGKLSQLKTFQMSCAEWRPEEGYHVLNTVFQTCRESLQNLYIDGYYTMPWYSQRPYEMDQFTAGLTSLTHLVTLSVDYFCLTNDCVVALAHARRAQMKKLKLVASDINPGSPAIATTSWDALSQACPSMRVDFCINGSVVSPALSVPALLDPVLHIHKIRLAFGKRFILIDTPTLQIADVLQYISSHFRHRLVRFQMDVDNHNDHLDTALIRLVRKCKNLVSLKVQAYFKSAETDRIVQEMVKERRNRLSRTVTQLTPRTAARHTGMVASSSATDRYEDYTSLAGMVVRSSQWVSQWWRGTPQSQGASKNRDAAHSSDASHCRDVSQSRDAPHSSDASHGSDDSLSRDASHSSDALHCRDASLSRDVSHRCDASHSSDDSLSRDASHSSDAPHSSDASQRRDQAGTSH